MRTARHLFPARIVHFVSCLLAVALSVTPAAAQRVGHLLTEREPLHPVLGVITDDPGPFNRFSWTRDPDHEVNHFYVPSADDEAAAEQAASVAGHPPAVKFNPVSGYPVAVWTTGGDRNDSAQRPTVWVSHFTVGGWTGPTVLAQGGRDPSLSIDPVSGQVHLVYWTPNDDGLGAGVWHRQAAAELTSWSDPVRVSDRREQAARPTALIHGDTLQIAYESHVEGLGSTPREIVVAASDRRSLQGIRPAFSRTAVAMTDFAGRNWVRLDSDGTRLLVRWLIGDRQAGWILQGEHGVWGPVGLQPKPSGEAAARRGKRERPGR